MDNVKISGLDVQDSLEFLKDALTIHFMNINVGDSVLSRDHADTLKDHIDRITKSASKGTKIPQDDVGSSARAVVLPSPISRFAPRATINPSANWGLLGLLPRELRDLIYDEVLFHTCSTYLQACKCTKEERRSHSGISLLRTCGVIYNEAVPLLYAPEVFGISAGWEASIDTIDGTVEWHDPLFYRQTTFGRQHITRLPHNVFSLMQNLEIDFTNTGMVWVDEPGSGFFGMTVKLLRQIEQICANLEDSAQFQRVDINLSFWCKFDDIDTMIKLLEPLQKLRGIHDPSITVCGYQLTDVVGLGLPPPHLTHDEPRWSLSDEFSGHLEQLLRSPHGTAGFLNDELEVFEDDFEGFDGETYHPWNEADESLMRRYLRDVYGTEDVEALHGGMPERWQVWLNSEHEDECDWFNFEEEEQLDN